VRVAKTAHSLKLLAFVRASRTGFLFCRDSFPGISHERNLVGKMKEKLRFFPTVMKRQQQDKKARSLADGVRCAIFARVEKVSWPTCPM